MTGGLKPGQVVRAKWTPLRRELERILADGAWHERDVLYRQVAHFIDPRMAAREYIRQYSHTSRHADPHERLRAAIDRLRGNQQRAMRVGARASFVSFMHSLVKQGRLETEVWNGRRRYRLHQP